MRNPLRSTGSYTDEGFAAAMERFILARVGVSGAEERHCDRRQGRSRCGAIHARLAPRGGFLTHGAVLASRNRSRSTRAPPPSLGGIDAESLDALLARTISASLPMAAHRVVWATSASCPTTIRT